MGITLPPGDTLLPVMQMTRSELIGLPLIEKESGRMLGRVLEVDYVPGEARLRGLYYRTAGLIHRICRMPAGRIAVLGSRAVICRRGPRETSRMPEGPARLPVYSQEGRLIGRLGDIHLDPATCAVTGMELRRSLADDLRYGRPLIPGTAEVTIQGRSLVWGGEFPVETLGPGPRIDP